LIHSSSKRNIQIDTTSSGNPSQGYIFRNLWGNPLNLDALLTEVILPTLEAEKIPWHGWHVSSRAGYETSPVRRFRQGHSANSASRECDHHDQHLRENGHAGRGRCDEEVGNEVFPSCSPILSSFSASTDFFSHRRLCETWNINGYCIRATAHDARLHRTASSHEARLGTNLLIGQTG
jgi:hypothetical protein